MASPCMQAGDSQETSTSGASADSDAESDGYGPEGLSWEAIMHSMQVAEPSSGVDAEAGAEHAAQEQEQDRPHGEKEGAQKEALAWGVDADIMSVTCVRGVSINNTESIRCPGLDAIGAFDVGAYSSVG